MNKKYTAAIRYFALTLTLLAALSFAACGKAFGGQNTYLTAEAGEVDISGAELERFESDTLSKLYLNGLYNLEKTANLSCTIENLTVTKHTGGEGSFTYDLVLKSNNKVVSLPVSATYSYARGSVFGLEPRDMLGFYGLPYLTTLVDGRLAVCSFEGVFIMDTDTMVGEKLEFGRLPIEAPFAIRAVQLDHDGKFTLLATDKEFDYIVKLNKNNEVNGYRKVSLNNMYLFDNGQDRPIFGRLVAASDSYEYLLTIDLYGYSTFYYDGKADEYLKLTQRTSNEFNQYNIPEKMVLYRTPEDLGFKNYIGVATYDNGETIRIVNFDGSKLASAFNTHMYNYIYAFTNKVYEPSYAYKKDIATYYLGTNFVEIEVNFAANTAHVEYTFTKEMLNPEPFATSSDGRYELYAANEDPEVVHETTQVVMYDTKKKTITYLALWEYGGAPKYGHAGFFEDDNIYLQQGPNLFIFAPKTAQQGPTLALNVQGDFDLYSRIHSFRRDPGDKSLAVVYSPFSPSLQPKTYSIAFYSAAGELISSVPSDIHIAYIGPQPVELSITVNGNTYIVKGYDGDNKPVVHFEYTVGDTAIVNKL